MKVRNLVFDSSIWIDALNGVETQEVKLLKHCIENNDPVVIFPIIARELLQGIRQDDLYHKVLKNLKGFPIVTCDIWELEIGAADLFRSLRKKGITIRKPNDCVIAFIAIYHNLILVHNDSDFNLIASGSKLEVHKS
ncbi:hypothetical protein SAMN06298216_3949 [Spirosomataceae bacterium TFI 002]|nr:hypothetical protein SAMN06298216_3949 [Spirosomataceae bacterium TFI 002]